MGRIRILKQVKCLQCDTIGIKCKSLCPACYRNKTRHTPEGKLKVKLYNDKVQRQKLLNKKPKEKKLPKEKKICECGKIAIAKNLCRNCYQKNKNYIYKPRKRKSIDATDKIDLSIKIHERNTGKYYQKARAGQSKTKLFVMKEITEYLKYNSDFGNACYLSIENKVLHLEDYFDCKPMYIDMNKIYKH